MRIEPRRSHTSRTQTHTFQRITAYGGIHHTYIEQGFFLFRRGYISGKQHFQGLLRPVIDRIRAKLRHHFINGSFLLADFHLTVIVPVSFRAMRCFGRLNHFFRLLKGRKGIRRRFIHIVPVIYIPLGIDTVTVVHQLEFGGDMFVNQLARTVCLTGKVLFKRHIIHKIQIDFLWKVHGGTTHKIGTIQSNVQVSRKTEGFGIEGYKRQVHTRLARYRKRVHQIIFIE